MPRRTDPPPDDAPRPVQRGLFGPLDEPTARRVEPAPVAADLVALGQRLPTDLRLGTSSWNFPGWRGLVYAPKAPKAQLSRHGLAAYAQHPLLRTVGVDRTFYAPITAAEFADYAAQVPASFRFLVKGLGELLTPQRPDGRRNERYLDARAFAAECVVPAVEGLGDRLGTLLLQFPPQPTELCADPPLFAQLLQVFLAALPAGVPYAVELRDEALFTERYVEVLHATGAQHGFVVHPRMPQLARQRELVPLDGPGRGPLVLRWMLHAGFGYEAAKARYEPFDRLVDPDPAQRSAIADLVLAAMRQSRAMTVVVNNKAEGSSPRSVQLLAEAIAAALPTGW
ncbi:MAG: DUF72 domain-containing protein [Planctomycetota bacterium]